jgi:nicotinate-nucleotide adenylyltransferase
MALDMTRIALFGGSFNPVHAGHLAIAEAARKALRLDRVLFIPCRLPPHKSSSELAPARDRVAMLRLAIRGRPRFRVSCVELRRPGPSYTIRTVEALRRRLAGGAPGRPPPELILLIGADMLADLPTWYRANALVRRVRVAAAERPGWSIDSLCRPLARAFGDAFVRGLERRRFDAPRVAVSSTEIRRRVRAGRSIRGLVPDPVARYIRSHGLYAGGGRGRGTRAGTRAGA